MIEFYPNSIYYPREAVDEKLAKGELEKTKKYLFGWTERHREEIWECAREDAEQPSDEILLDKSWKTGKSPLFLNLLIPWKIYAKVVLINLMRWIVPQWKQISRLICGLKTESVS